MFPRLCTGGGNGYVGRWSVSSRVGRRKDRPSYVSSLNRHRGKGQQKVTVEPVHVRRHSGHAANPAARRAPGTPITKHSTTPKAQDCTGSRPRYSDQQIPAVHATLPSAWFDAAYAGNDIGERSCCWPSHDFQNLDDSFDFFFG